MRHVAAAVFVGLALLAGAVIYQAEATSNDDPHANAEEIARTFVEVQGTRPVSVQRVSGPFVLIKTGDGECALIDVSTQYADEEGADNFWASFPDEGDTSADC